MSSEVQAKCRNSATCRQFRYLRKPLFQVILDGLDVMVRDGFDLLDPVGCCFIEIADQLIEKSIGFRRKGGQFRNPLVVRPGPGTSVPRQSRRRWISPNSLQTGRSAAVLPA